MMPVLVVAAAERLRGPTDGAAAVVDARDVVDDSTHVCELYVLLGDAFAGASTTRRQLAVFR